MQWQYINRRPPNNRSGDLLEDHINITTKENKTEERTKVGQNRIAAKSKKQTNLGYRQYTLLVEKITIKTNREKENRTQYTQILQVGEEQFISKIHIISKLQ